MKKGPALGGSPGQFARMFQNGISYCEFSSGLGMPAQARGPITHDLVFIFERHDW
jgi:hypothetical protein